MADDRSAQQMRSNGGPERGRVRRDVLAAISDGVDSEWPEERFGELAVRVFEHQFSHNPPYRRLCEAMGVREVPDDWSAIPAVPTSAFKVADLCAFPPEEARVVYLTSGTTVGQHGRHLLCDTTLYDASLFPNLAAHLFPGVTRMRLLVLAPPPAEAPHSSLSHMLGLAVERWGDERSGFYVSEAGVELDSLHAALAAAEAGGEAVGLLGTAFAFVHFLDDCSARRRRYRLAKGSRVMDTGGYKGRSRELSKADLYAEYAERLGIPDHHVVNEYGMTEMGSQFYDRVLRDAVEEKPPRRRKVPPPWVRTVVLDPETLRPVPPGQPGLLRHFDLANVDSVLAIQTEDLGIWVDDGFEVLGRASGAEPRGCSLAVER